MTTQQPMASEVLSGLLDHMLNGVAYCRMVYEQGRPHDFQYIYTNPAFHKQTGLPEVTGKFVSEIIPGVRETDYGLLETYGRVAKGGPPETFVINVAALDQWFSVAVYCPKVDYFVALFDVITERKKAELALQESETQLRFVLEGSELGFWDWDITAGAVLRNERWALMLGYTHEEILQTTQQWSDFVHPEDRERAWASIFDVVEGRTSAHKFEYRMLHKDGSIRWILDQAKVMQRNGQGKATRMCGTHTDITERKLLELELTRQAHIDYLTGVCNRGYFMNRAEQELRRANRYSNKLSILMLDIDRFKLINDRHGHKVGDVVLQVLTTLCQAALRDIDILGRLGGEEFAVLLPETENILAIEVAERLREEIGKLKIPLEGGLPIQITASIGVSSMTSPDDNIDVLLNRADKALYQAKNSGRNRVCASLE